MYDVRSVSFRRGNTTLVRDASLAIERGTFCAVLGPNGAGKTTLLRLLAGDLAPASGSIALNGRDLRTYGIEELAAARAVLSQRREMTFSFRVREIVALGRFRFGARDDGGAAVERALADAGASELADRRYDTLSGGEAVKADIARILAQETDVVLLDEPTNHLDPRHQYDALHAIHRLTRRGVTVVAVLHDFNAAGHFADRVVLMHRGAIAACGAPSDVLRPELLEAVFGLPCTLATTASGRRCIVPVAEAPTRRAEAC